MYIVKWQDTLETPKSPEQAVLMAIDAICKGETVAFEVTDTETNEKVIIDASKL